ncbi:MAG: hypothetical protein OMM_13761, partial [Candidatus Magnetoglobus multicellularis str. Araruama]
EVRTAHVEEYPPVIATLPWQTISKGYEFAPLNLNYLVSDTDHAYTEINWQFFGQNKLSVIINDGVAAITILDANWTGSETITFTAVDPTGLSDSKSVEFQVIENVHCPTSFSIPDSGLNKCYDQGYLLPCPRPGESFYGQDGNYLINETSYTRLDIYGNDLPDDAQDFAMLRDNITGLIWEIKTAKDDLADYSNVHDADNLYSWYDSNPQTSSEHSGSFNDGQNTEGVIKNLNQQKFGGFSDWRLPSHIELFSIVKASNNNPVIDKDLFQNMMSKFYWSASSDADDAGSAWGVDFGDGIDYSYKKYSSHYVRAVRGGQCRSLNHFVINIDGTVTDISRGLIWQQASTEKSWPEALKYCENLTLGAYSDWRLPEKLELQSIIDLSRSYP